MVKVLCKGGPYYWIREPYTDEEKRAFNSPDPNDWPKGYKGKYFLLDGEIYPREPWEKSPFMEALGNTTGITFYGGSPHRPSKK
jgi:hypothetical protein